MYCDIENIENIRDIEDNEIVDMILENDINSIIDETDNELINEVDNINNNNSLENLNLDKKIVKYYSDNGLTKLYDWQYECITQEGVLKGRNLVYSAPTSGGKTLVSELLMYKKVLDTGCGALVVFPFVSLVTEKRDIYYKLGGEICGLKVCEFHHGSRTNIFEEFDIGVATIEKANTLINYYIEERILFKRLGIIIIDELHLLGDEQRGYILEIMLSKIILFCKLYNAKNKIQIVGMSATLPNLDDIGKWLDAIVYKSNYRPIPLIEHIVIKGKAYKKPNNMIMDIDKSFNLSLNKIKNWDFYDIYDKYDSNEFNNDIINSNKWKYPIVDMNELLIITWEALKKGDSVLVFCPSKYSVEYTALFYARCLKKNFCEGINLNDSDNYKIFKSLKSIEKLRNELIQELEKKSNYCKKSNQNNILIECISRGIGYHHSGLSHIERKIVEKGYRNGVLSLLTATSTLAAGVNLPSKRVIFRGINIGKSNLTCTDYKQMSGRAGRAGQKGAFGESFILINNNNLKDDHINNEIINAIELITSDMLPLKSTFFNKINGLIRLILEILCISYNFDFNNIKNINKNFLNNSILYLLIECTLMSYQIQFYKNLYTKDEYLQIALNYLIEKEMIIYKENKNNLIYENYTLNYYCTCLGKSIVASGLSPSIGFELYLELQNNMNNIIINDMIYMAFQITPFPFNDNENNFIIQIYFRIDWNILYNIINQMNIIERNSLIKLGFDLELISWASQLGDNNLPNQLKQDKIFKRYQRLYASLIIKSLLNNIPIKQIISIFKSITIHDIQQLFNSALSMCISCITFTQNMNWWSLNIIFQNYLKRLQSVTLLEEYSDIFLKDYILHKNIKKLISIKGMSSISAFELYNSLSIKTFNQFLIIPRRILIHSINNRIYSSISQNLNYIHFYIDQIFDSSLKKKIPLYNQNKNLNNSILNFKQFEIQNHLFMEDHFDYCEKSILQLFDQNSQIQNDQLENIKNEDSIICHQLENHYFAQDDIDWEERLLFWSTPICDLDE